MQGVQVLAVAVEFASSAISLVIGPPIVLDDESVPAKKFVHNQ